MERENEILNELKALNSPLAGLSRAMPYAVPEGFFDGLAQQIVAGVLAAEGEDSILALPKSLPYKVPQNYFEDTAAQILAITALPATEEPAFEVPAGYFEALPGRIMTAVRTKEQPAAKPRIIDFRPARRVIKWAAAAMLILGIGISSYSIYFTPDHRAERLLASVDGDVITDYVTQNNEDAPDAGALAMNTPTASAVKALSKDEIATYLDETGWEDAATAD